MSEERKSILVFVFDADPSVPELIEMLQAKYGAVTATRFEFTPPIVPVPAWWEVLPNRAHLKVIRDTTVWKDSGGTIKHSTRKAGDTSMTYWNKHRNGMLCVFSSATMDLWVNVNDLELAK